MRTVKRIVLAVLLSLLAPALRAPAMVNPALQPIDLFQQHRIVLGLRVVSIDPDAKVVKLAVVECCKGQTPVKNVTVLLANEKVVDVSGALLWEGETVVAFVGQTRRGHESELLLYAGSGRWQAGSLEKADDLSRWRWDQDLEQKQFGTFNGAAERLLEMLVDAREGRYFFPAVPSSKFKKAIVIDRFKESVRGVAMYDLDGDGRQDIYVCAASGNRAYLQVAPLRFEDRTEALGLSGAASPSVSIADVNGDGVPDLLVGGIIYLGSDAKQRRFSKTSLLPAEAPKDLKCSAFVDINGDGYPDVVISRRDRGLAVYLNPGKSGGPLVDATAALGLAANGCGNAGDGFFAAGDFNGDGRVDLFYAVGNGILLLQGADGRFQTVAHDLEYDLELKGDAKGCGGTAAFAPLWRPDSMDLVFSAEAGVHLFANMKGKLKEMTEYGNEITETSFRQLPLIAEDLDADGNVDILVLSRQDLPSKFYVNRGHGSFMCPNKYKRGIFPAEVMDHGAWGVVAGDVNGDGANDLLIGGMDGSVMLLENGVLEERFDKKAPTRQEQVLQRTRILTVRPRGKIGVLGARVSLADASGRTVAVRTIGGNIATGCCGPDLVNLAVREPNKYVLTVRYSDGLARTWPVDLTTPQKHVVMDATRDGGN